MFKVGNQRVTCPYGNGYILRSVVTEGTTVFGLARIGGEDCYEIRLDNGNKVVALKAECTLH